MLLVFDLNFTLWNAGGTRCDHTTPPYRKRIDHILDGGGRTHSPGLAIELLEVGKMGVHASLVDDGGDWSKAK